jgi:hypothetical protein
MGVAASCRVVIGQSVHDAHSWTAIQYGQNIYNRNALDRRRDDLEHVHQGLLRNLGAERSGHYILPVPPPTSHLIQHAEGLPHA